MLKTFFNLNQRIPRGKEMGSIQAACYSGYWKEFGIDTWNDLLRYIFGEVNTPDRLRYHGEIGLKKAIKELKDFKMKYDKKPVSKSKGFYGIYTASRLGKWKEFGINSWEALLNHTFKKNS